MNERAITPESSNKSGSPHWQPRLRKPELIKVTERIFCAADYAISNVGFVITENGVVVVDTTETPKVAQRVFDELRKICRLPVSHIIYTHFHDDHVHGASVFHTANTKIIAQERMAKQRKEIVNLLAYKALIDGLQFGAALDVRDRGISLESHPKAGLRRHQSGTAGRAQFQDGGYLPPDITFDKESRFNEGGVAFELYHTQGQIVDHLMVWLPWERALFPGDLFYADFPMLSNPMKLDRPILAWAESLDRMRALRPEYLVPSHSRPRRGATEIASALNNYAQAIRFVYDETVRFINEGLPLRKFAGACACRRIWRGCRICRRATERSRGPSAVSFAITPAGMISIPPISSPRLGLPSTARCWRRAAGRGRSLRRTRRALAEGGNQLVLELTDLIFGARPKNGAARQMRRAALERLAPRATNGVEQNIYRGAATALRDGAPTPMPADGGKTDDGAASIFNDRQVEK